jgi:beta-xylosidase
MNVPTLAGGRGLPRALAASALGLCLSACAFAYINPIITNTRDPDCSHFDGMYYMIEPAGGPTNGGYYKFRSSKDLVNWSADTPLFQQAAGVELWQGHLWHPDGYSNYYLYYAKLVNGVKSIGVATAPAITGPWTAQADLITGQGAIDPYPYDNSDGTMWIYYKNDSDKCIYVQKLSNPTTRASGYSPKRLIVPQAGTWEDNGYVSAEGPCMRKYSGKFFLLYTGGPYGQYDYAIGYAYSSNPDGPFTKYSGNPIMSNAESPNVYSPGVPCVVKDNVGDDWVVYRQRETIDRLSPRQITIDKLTTTNSASNVINAKATNGVSKTNPAPLP